jgi:rSAM/selenodomain-associated transferase 1
MRYPAGRILVFAKAPVPGKVKTRLRGVYGDRGAARLYQLMLGETLLKASELAPVELWCAPDTRHPRLRALARRYRASVHRQHPGDLGRRLGHALSRTLERADWGLVIGGDCVSLSTADLDLACAALARGKDAVLGPAEDGGYVLLGVRRVAWRLFRGVRWGSRRVLGQTRCRLRQQRYDWVELPIRWDVDRPADVRRWRLIPGSSRWYSDRT